MVTNLIKKETHNKKEKMCNKSVTKNSYNSILYYKNGNKSVTTKRKNGRNKHETHKTQYVTI